MPTTTAHNSAPNHILACFARGREIGFVLLQGTDVLRYGVKTVRGRKQGEAFRARVVDALVPIVKLMESPGILVTERLVHQRHGQLSSLLPQLLHHFGGVDYPLCEIPLTEAKRTLCQAPKATHAQLIQATVRRYPTLWSLVQNVGREKRKYWSKVVLALALAETARHRQC